MGESIGEGTKRRARPGGIAAVLCVALAVGAVGLYVPAALTAPLPDPTVELTAPPMVAVPPAAELAMPRNGASLIAVTGPEDFAAMTGAAELVSAAGGDDARPMASLTKIITALAILDAKPLAADVPGPTIAFTEADVDLYDKYYVLGATIHSMKAGSTLSQRDALQIMLVGSASNYAEAVSTWAFGSQAGFRASARKWLDAHGLTATRVVEPTGIDARNVSTPGELVAIAKLAMADPVISSLVQMPSLDIEGHSRDGNTNILLGTHGVNGLKTGTLDGHGSNLLYSAAVDVGLSAPLSITGVVLGGFDGVSVAREVTTLLDSLIAGFHEVPLLEEDVELGTITTAWGQRAGIRTGSGGSILTWSDTAVTTDVSPVGPVTNGRAGGRVGTLTYTAGPVTKEIALELDGPIGPPDAWWRLSHPGQVFGR